MFDGLNWKKCLGSLVWHQDPPLRLTQIHYRYPLNNADVHWTALKFTPSYHLACKDMKRDLCFVAAQGYYTYYIFMFCQSCNSCQKGNEVVRDAWLFENLAHADAWRLSSSSFSEDLQSGPLKIHWRSMLRITMETTPSIQFWKLKLY